MDSIFKIFQNLNGNLTSANDSYVVASLPEIKNHKIGISKNGLPLFFISCHDSKTAKILDCNLELISIRFNCDCELLSEEKQTGKGIFTIISLKTESVEMLEYFLEIVYMVVKKLPQTANFAELKIEIDKLIKLFSKFSAPPQKALQGLWAELLIIEQSNNPDYLIQAWHSNFTDKFDFNDGIDKIEVKSTARSKRIHTFSIEQLNQNRNSNLIIASVFAVESGIGKSIFDLMHMIEKLVADKDLLFRVNEIVIETLGRDFEKAFDIYYDYQNATDSLSFFESASIPKIDSICIKPEISNVHFDCDLSGIQPLSSKVHKSLLHQSLMK